MVIPSVYRYTRTQPVQEQSGFRREEALHVLAGKLSIDGKRDNEEGKLNMCTNLWKTKRKRNKTSHMAGFINFALPVPVDLCTRWGKKGHAKPGGKKGVTNTDHRGTVLK